MLRFGPPATPPLFLGVFQSHLIAGLKLWPGGDASGPQAFRYSAACTQKETRAPKRHWRDWFGPVVPVMKPKVELLMSLDGLAKLA